MGQCGRITTLIVPAEMRLLFRTTFAPEYDLDFAIAAIPTAAAAMAKKYHFRGATLHGLNDIILNSGLSIDYNLVSRQAELFQELPR